MCGMEKANERPKQELEEWELSARTCRGIGKGKRKGSGPPEQQLRRDGRGAELETGESLKAAIGDERERAPRPPIRGRRVAQLGASSGKCPLRGGTLRHQGESDTAES